MNGRVPALKLVGACSALLCLAFLSCAPDLDNPFRTDNPFALLVLQDTNCITVSWHRPKVKGQFQETWIYRNGPTEDYKIIRKLGPNDTVFVDYNVVSFEYGYYLRMVIDGQESNSSKVVSAIPIMVSPPQLNWRAKGNWKDTLFYNILNNDRKKEVVFTNVGDRQLKLSFHPEQGWIVPRFAGGNRSYLLGKNDSVVMAIQVLSDSLTFRSDPYYGDLVVRANDTGFISLPVSVVKVTPASELIVDETTIDFDTGNTSLASFTVRNEGNIGLNCRDRLGTSQCIVPDKTWLEVSPAGLENLLPGQETKVHIAVKRKDPGLYNKRDSTLVRIESDGGLHDLWVRVDNRGPFLKVIKPFLEANSFNGGLAQSFTNSGIGMMDYRISLQKDSRFEIEGADTGWVGMGDIVEFSLSPDTSTFILNGKYSEAVTIESRNGGTVSFTASLNYKDSMPPSPVSLRELLPDSGLIDLGGVSKLAWVRTSAKDFGRYDLIRTNPQSGEVTVVQTFASAGDTAYNPTVALFDSSEFRVRTYDVNGNFSTSNAVLHRNFGFKEPVRSYLLGTLLSAEEKSGLKSAGISIGGVKVATSNQVGVYAVANPPAGKTYLQYEANGYIPDSQSVTIDEAGVTNASASLHLILAAPVASLQPGQLSMALRWHPVLFAERYLVFRNDSDSFGPDSKQYKTIADTQFLDEIPPKQEYHYRVAAENRFGRSVLSKETLSGKLEPFPPSITSHPANTVVPEGSDFSFSVEASGYPPLRYQWFRDDSAMQGETSSKLLFKPVQDADEGARFRVLVKNAYDSTFSEAASISIGRLPKILSQPADTAVLEGASARFSLALPPGALPATIMWLKNGTPILGASGQSVVLPLVVYPEDDGAKFLAEITNTYGTTYTRVATLIVNAAPRVTSKLVDKYIPEGGTVQIQAVVIGTPPLSYSWSSEGVEAATTPTFTLSNASHAHTGKYRLIVSNAFGQAISNEFEVFVGKPPTIVNEVHDAYTCADYRAEFAVGASGDPPFQYQWFWNGSLILGANSNEYQTPDLLFPDHNQNQFYVEVTNKYGKAVSGPAVVYVDPNKFNCF